MHLWWTAVFLPIFYLLMTKSHVHGQSWAHCRYEKLNYLTNDGDYLIGGLFPVHYQQSNGDFKFNEPGITWIEAMLFTIEEINNRTDILPGVKLGYRIYDSCNNVHLAVAATMHMTAELKRILSATTDDWCTCKKTSPSVIGVIGDAASASSTRVAAVLGASLTPQISYSTTTPSLSEKVRYPAFFRTIAPDNLQANCITDLLLHFNWTYVNIVAQDDNYGRDGATQLKIRLDRNNICTSKLEIYNIKDVVKTAAVITKLKEESEATVTILWCQISEAKVFFKEAEKQSLFYRTWIATEAYGSHDEILNMDRRVVQGMFGIIPHRFKYQPFEQRLIDTTPKTYTEKNPWLKWYWATMQAGSLSDCGPVDTRTNLSGLPRNKYIQVMNAVYALAHALDQQLTISNNFTIPDYLQQVQRTRFKGVGNMPVSFNEYGNPGVAVYSITNLRLETCSDGNRLQFNTEAGHWESDKQTVQMTSDVQYVNMSQTVPLSMCRPHCAPGFYPVNVPLNKCCWTCRQCPTGTAKEKSGNASCTKCESGYFPNMPRTDCIKPEFIYYKITSVSGIFLMILTIIAITCVAITIIVIRIKRNTPLVKSLNPNLSYLQLSSMILTFALPLLVYSTRPTLLHCSALLYGFVTFNTITMSIVFTKSDRLLRIFRASKSNKLSKKSKLRSNRVQFGIVVGLALFGIVLCTICYLTFPPKLDIKLTYDSPMTAEYSCKGHFTSILVVNLIYIFCIAIVCGVYAFRARKLPENYNEAKYTSFAMFIFCLTWAMFAGLYYSSSSSVVQIETFFYISLSSTLSILILMYAPKLYVILFRPERNTKEFVSQQLKHQTASRVTSTISQSVDSHSIHKTNTLKSTSPTTSVNSLVRLSPKPVRKGRSKTFN